MEPVSALIFALLAAWADATAQAREETRVAGKAIRGDLRSRQEAWAQQLADRLVRGRSGGPATALWWGWAALRTTQAVRKGLRRAPKEREPAKAIRGKTGPFRRVWDAAAAAARHTWREQRRAAAAGSAGDNKAGPASGDGADTRTRRTRMAVCRRCGAVVATAALKPAPGTGEPACLACRNEMAADTTGDADTATDDGAAAPERTADDVVDADVIDRKPQQINPPRPELGAAPTAPQSKQPTRPTPPRPAPAPPGPAAPDLPAGPGANQAGPSQPLPAPQAAPAGTAPAIEGTPPMAPRHPGQIVPARPHTLATAARGNGGESYTHGAWNRVVADIYQRLDMMPAVLEMMLRRLTTADAGRTQVRDVIKFRDDVDQYMQLILEMLRDVNQREAPVLAAVEDAGGPDEIAGIAYLSDV